MALQLERPSPQRPAGGSTPARDRAFIIAAVGALLVLAALAVYLIGRSDDGLVSTDDAPTSSSSISPSTSNQVPPPLPPTATTGTPAPTTTAATSSTDGATISSPSTTRGATTAGPSTTTSPSTTSTTTGGSTTGLPPAEAPEGGAVWPDPGRVAGLASPVEAARSFAVDLAGFRDPVLGPFRADDTRSGAIEIRPSADGPVTTVLLHRTGSGNAWWVVGAGSDDIVVDDPEAGDPVTGTLHLVGRARAFEGNVTVALWRHGDDEPILVSAVTGRGDGVLGDFDETFDVAGGATGPGFVLLTAPSAEDGSAWTVTALPLRIG